MFLVRDKEKLKEVFRRNQIELGEWFNLPFILKVPLLKTFTINKGICPIVEFLADYCVNLPTYPKIKTKDVERVKCIEEFKRNSANSRIRIKNTELEHLKGD